MRQNSYVFEFFVLFILSFALLNFSCNNAKQVKEIRLQLDEIERKIK